LAIQTKGVRAVLGLLSAFVAWACCGMPVAQAQTTLSASVSGGNGTINGPASKTVANGSYGSISVTPNSGYHLDTVSFCTSVANSYTNTVTSGALTSNCTMSVTFAPNSDNAFTGPFKHPGILLNLAQLDYIKQQVAGNVAPWSTGFNAAKASTYGSLTYLPSPRSVVDDNVAASETAVKNDSLAAYTQALLWYVTGNTTYANNAVAIMNGWARTLTGGFVSTRNPSNWTYRVDAALSAQNFARAAEIVRYTYSSGWSAADIASFQAMLATQFLPAIPDGMQQGNYAGYYNSAMAEARMAIGVFNEDLTAFNLGLAAWRRALPAYIYMKSDGANPGCPIDWTASYCTPARLLSLWFSGKTPTPAYVDGLTQDTYYSNLQNAGYGIAAIEQAAETAYQQGIDLWNESTFGTLNAWRLAAALELNAGYISQCGATGTTCATNIASGFTSAPARVGAMEIAYNHLVNRLSDFSLPNTAAYLANARPTGVFNTGIAWQTLTHYGQGAHGFPDFSFTPPPTAVSVPPGGSNTLNVTLASSLGFGAPVPLAVSGLPPGVTASFSPTSVTPYANGTATATLTIMADASAALGTTTVTVTGTTGTTTHTAHTAAFPLTVTPMVTGVCGGDNGQTLTSSPSNLCSSGTASGVGGSGHPWSWSCSGSSGGANATCSATLRTWSVSTVGNAGGTISAPASMSVDNGTSTTFTVGANSGYVIASVSGSGCAPSLVSGNPYTGGSYTTGALGADCTITATFSSSSVAGVCGSANSQALPVRPSANLCSAGTASAVSGNGHPWNWNCAGANGGANAACAAAIQSWTVTTGGSGTGGTVSAPASATIDNGSATTFTASADNGYSITAVSGAGCSPALAGAGGTYTTGATTANCAVTVTFSPDDTFDQLRKTWIGTIVGVANDMSDANIAASVNASASAATNSLNTMDRTGAGGCLWSGTTYCDWTNSATVTNNYGRLRAMASAWAQPGGSKQGDPALLQGIIYGLDWMNSRYYNASSTGAASGTNNWWDWQIGAPKELGQAAMLIYSQLTATQIANYTAAMDHFVPDPLKDWHNGNVSTGANLADQVFVALASGVLKKSGATIAQARDAMSPLFMNVTTGDGFYADGSFIQHGNVAYTGSYGAVELDDDALLLSLLNNSAWPVTDPNQANVLARAMQSYAPLMYNGAMMDMVMGRAISRIAQWDHRNGRGVLFSLLQLAQGAPAQQKAELLSFIKGQVARDTAFSNYQSSSSGTFTSYYQGVAASDIADLKALMADASIPAGAPMSASYNFASMARVSHLRPGFAFGLSLFSPQITAYEAGNNENLKAWYTGAGMSYVYNADLTQFDANFWPTINPVRLPGVTTDGATKTPSQWALLKNPNNWVGASSLNGLYTSAGMQFSMANDTGSSLAGYKSWFMFDNKMVALGAGINGGGAVETIVENRRINQAAGDNALVVNGTAQPTALGTASTLPGVNWAWLDGNAANSGIGYYFPTPVSLNTLRETRSGTWNAINGGGSSTSYTNNYLSLALAHGSVPTNASYAYVVLPNQTPDSMVGYAAAPDIQVLANTAAVQAVVDTSINAVGANFWTNTSTTVNDQHGVAYLTSTQQASVTTQQTGDVLSVAVADPTQVNTGTITITINRSAAAVMVADPQVTVTQMSPTIVLSVAVNGSVGKSYQAKLRVPTAPDFSVALGSTAINLVQGDSGSNAVTVENLNGVVATETLSLSGLPAGVTASFSPASVSPVAGGNAGSTLTLSAAPDARTGSADVTVTATSGSVTRTSVFGLNVQPAPDFTVSVAPANLSVQQGASGNASIAVASLNGFSAATDLSVSGLPAGVRAAFSPASVTPAAGGSATSNLVLTVGGTAAPGTSTITVSSTTGAKSHSTTFSLDVPANVKIVQSGLTMNRSTGLMSGTVTVTNLSDATISGNLQLRLDALAAGVTLVNATGTQNGAPVIALPTSSLAPGGSVTVTTSFHNPNRSLVSYTPKLLVSNL
jgi:hyaluronate lyase